MVDYIEDPEMPPMKLKYFRLITGEDIIANAVEVPADDIESGYYMIFDPLKVIYMTGRKPGVFQVSLMQWVFPKICDTQEFKLYEADILIESVPSRTMEEHYYKSLDRFAEDDYEVDEFDSKDKYKETLLSEDNPDDMDSSKLEEISKYLSNLQRKGPKGTLH